MGQNKKEGAWNAASNDSCLNAGQGNHFMSCIHVALSGQLAAASINIPSAVLSFSCALASSRVSGAAAALSGVVSDCYEGGGGQSHDA